MPSKSKNASHSSSISVKMPAPVTVNLTCYGFHLCAGDFLQAAQTYKSTARTASFVGHFLCCQSIELSLKAFLSFKGLKRDQLRKAYGHNLVKLYKEAEKQGIGSFVTLDVEADLALLTKADEWYDTPGGKKFQYFDVFEALHAFSRAPELIPIENLATRLQSEELREALLNA